MARKSIYTYTVQGDVATFQFTNGERFSIYRDALPADVAEQAFWHGIKQKVADAAAIPCDTETGRSASLQDKIDAMRAVADRLPHSWNAIAEGNGGNVGGWLLKALLVKYPAKTREQLVAFLATKDAKQKAALRADPSIAPIITRLQDEAGKSASAGIDTDELLGELND